MSHEVFTKLLNDMSTQNSTLLAVVLKCIECVMIPQKKTNKLHLIVEGLGKLSDANVVSFDHKF